MSLADEVEALRWEVGELRKEVARIQAAQQARCGCVHVCTTACAHPAWQQIWSGPALTINP